VAAVNGLNFFFLFGDICFSKRRSKLVFKSSKFRPGLNFEALASQVDKI
jgi:hypothetical protein